MSLAVVERGSGSAIVLIHGSAADHSTWSVQLAGLAGQRRLIAYDRRSERGLSVADHAEDAAAIIEERVDGACPVVGSSFGAVVALELARRRPELVSTLLLCEPPLAPSDYQSAVPPGFGCRYDELEATRSGEDAAEFFLRTVLGDAAFEAMPRSFQQRTRAAHAAIRSDISALARYPVRYDRLAQEVRAQVHLLGGDRSAPFYAETLDSLQTALPGSSRHLLRGAGHMMQVDAHRQFNKLVLAVC
jgi:pimeloyl-ACP methyl ester carboxylesterase